MADNENLAAILAGLNALKTSVAQLQNSTTESQRDIERLRNQMEAMPNPPVAMDVDHHRTSTPTEETNRTMLPMVSDSMSKLYDLPTFSGNAEEWPLFLANFNDTTEAFRYSHRQNLMRLHKCLVGPAREAVTSMLIFPQDVPKVIEELEFRFGRPDLIIRSQLSKIQQFPEINEKNLMQIVTFSTKVKNIVAFITSANCKQHLCNTNLMEQLVCKLPASKQFDWAKHSVSIRPFPTVADFSLWLSDLAKIISLMPPSGPANSRSHAPISSPALHSKNFSQTQQPKRIMHLNDTEQKSSFKCYQCGEGHSISNCKVFNTSLTVPARWERIKSLQLCFSCLRKGHSTGVCRARRFCGIDGCRRYHHRSLHDMNSSQPLQLEVGSKAAGSNMENIEASSSTVHPVLNCRKSPETSKHLFKVLPVTLYGPNGKVNIFAMFDEGSAISILEEEVSNQLGVKGQQQSLVLQWFGEKTTTENSTRVNLEIEGVGETNKYMIKNIHTISNLNLPSQSFLKNDFKHFEFVPISDYVNVKPALLLGLDHAFLAATSTIVQAGIGSPIAAKTKLGWLAYGPTSIIAQSYPMVLHVRQKHEDDLHQVVAEYFSTENFGMNNVKMLLESEDDKKAKRIMSETVQRKGRHFEIGLLWKNFPPVLPNSLEMATKRLRSIEKKMDNDKQFAEKYHNEMTKYIQKGYARKLSEQELCSVSQAVWYLPHFAVYSPHKPDKLRIVFDAAAAVAGIALNSVLLKGPEQAKPLLGILFKFRVGKVGVAADIREMFSQVKIRQVDQHAQRFLWRNNTEDEIEHYAMASMIFGAVCSPCCAEFVKNYNAEEFRHRYPDAVTAIVEKHYVDDFVCSFDNEEEAIQICQQVVNINSEAGFELRNFISSHKNLQAVMNKTASGEGTKSVNMERQSTVDKVLGMFWDTATDTFRFQTIFHRIPKQVLEGVRPPTKRELLGIVMAVFDPYGLLAAFMGYSKVLVQETWKCQLHWDECIPADIHEKWIAWWREFQRVQEFKIDRCYSQNLNKSSSVELHVFVDASQIAFAAVGYLRIVHTNGVDVAFIAGKSRCAPKKLMSIPRLELQAAVLGIRLFKMIRSCHEINFSKVCFWSDSRTVLYWINSSERKYKAFVGHRIAEILTSSNQSQWFWVPTNHNTADVATRPIFPPKYEINSKWIRGPEFLQLDIQQWPEPPSSLIPENFDEEVKTCHIVQCQASSSNLIEFNRFSCYLKLKRSMAWVLRARKIFLKQLTSHSKDPSLTAEEIQNAEKYICKLVQRDTFTKEINALKSSQPIGKASQIYKLTPYLDEEGLLRVYGRIDKALYLPFDVRRPILLPKNHKVTELVVRHFHKKQHHQNIAVILNEVRQKFWIPDIKSVLKKIQRTCMTCKISKVKPNPPLMGQLPEDRVTPFVRPFTYTGVDLFGPLNVTIGRRQEKRWGVIFTCLTVRAAHLELAESLSTDAFIICLRNFINRRGTPSRLRSDNGTNFIGAQKELKGTDQLFDIERLKDEAANKNIEWVFNCPANPSSGGCWERLIRIIKSVLHKTLREVAPRVETLQSVLIEAENIINSRPLTDIPLESEEDEPLTPNHFLLGCVNSTQTPHPADEKICLKKQWRIAQNLKDRFWKRWIIEYLPQLIGRAKWHSKVQPLQVEDLVIICDPAQSRSHWEKGRIMKVFRAKDGQVRFADVKTSHGIIRRPASRLAVLTVDGESQSDSRGVEC